MTHHDFADAVDIGVVDADLDVVGHRHAGGIRIDLAERMQRVGAEQFGLAIEGAQRHAHGPEEFEGIRPERGAAGRGRAQPREAEPVAQRAEQELVGQHRTLALRQRRKPGLHADVEEFLLERRGVHHAGAHVGGDRFPEPRREQHEGRRDLAEIVHHGLGLFDEVDLHPAQQPFAERVDLFHDPGQRQHRDIFVVRPLRIERQIGRAMSEDAPGRQHRQLGIGRRAEVVQRIATSSPPGRVDQPVVQARLARRAVAPHRGELLGFHQARIVVFPHAARIGIDDVLEVRRAVGQRQQLVDLLLVFGEHQFRVAIAEQIGRFLVQHVAVKAEAHGADGMRCDFRGYPVRAVVTDDADDVAAPETEFDHAEREIMHAGLVVVPGEDAPQPEILFAQRDLAAVLPGVEAQQFWIGVGLGGASGVIHHAALSRGAGVSSGSTRTSSSSPR